LITEMTAVPITAPGRRLTPPTTSICDVRKVGSRWKAAGVIAPDLGAVAEQGLGCGARAGDRRLCAVGDYLDLATTDAACT